MPFWKIEILMQSSFVWIICPLMIIFYEGNEKWTIQQRIKRAFKTQMPFFTFLIFWSVITFFIMPEIYIPSELANKFAHPRGQLKELFQTGKPNYNDTEDLLNGKPKEYYKYDSAFGQHIIIVTLFIGVFFFTIFAGVGFVSVPWDIFVNYMYRPKYIDPS